jgi:hypothetical protein
MVALAKCPVDRLSRDLRTSSGCEAARIAPLTFSMPPMRADCLAAGVFVIGSALHL